jgi:hypothetical protein
MNFDDPSLPSCIMPIEALETGGRDSPRIKSGDGHDGGSL